MLLMGLLLEELLKEGEVLLGELDRLEVNSIIDKYYMWLDKGKDIYSNKPHISNNVHLFCRDNNKVGDITTETHTKLLGNIRQWIKYYGGEEEVSF